MLASKTGRFFKTTPTATTPSGTWSSSPTEPPTAASPNHDALDRRFLYDPVYQLVSATGRETDTVPDPPWLDIPRSTDVTKARAYTETYGYDPVGNLLTLRHATDTAGTGAYTRTFALSANSNHLAALTVGSLTILYDHDLCGNMTAETTSRHLEWDHANRLATFRVQAGSAEPSLYAQYRDDSAGSRVIKVLSKQNSPTVVTIYPMPGFERVLRVMTTSAGTQKTAHDILHVIDVTTRIATIRRGPPLPDDLMPDVTYRLADHLGSISAECDVAGGLLNREEYNVYGETSFGSFARKRYRFAGAAHDEESGLSYHGARYYAVHLARWTSCDPLWRGADSSYKYCDNSPLRFIDPGGAQEVEAVSSPSPAASPALSAVSPPLSAVNSSTNRADRPERFSKEDQKAWDAAESAAYDDASVSNLISTFVESRMHGQGLLNRDLAERYATVRGSAFSANLRSGNLGRAAIHLTAGLVECFGAALFGNSPKETATNVGKLYLFSAIIGAGFKASSTALTPAPRTYIPLFEIDEVVAPTGPKSPLIIEVAEQVLPNPIRGGVALDEWNKYLGADQTNTHPRTGVPDPNRVVSGDGTRSVRFGDHEMKSPRLHYHLEGWTFDPDPDLPTLTITNDVRNVNK